MINQWPADALVILSIITSILCSSVQIDPEGPVCTTLCVHMRARESRQRCTCTHCQPYVSTHRHDGEYNHCTHELAHVWVCCVCLSLYFAFCMCLYEPDMYTPIPSSEQGKSFAWVEVVAPAGFWTTSWCLCVHISELSVCDGSASGKYAWLVFGFSFGWTRSS